MPISVAPVSWQHWSLLSVRDFFKLAKKILHYSSYYILFQTYASTLDAHTQFIFRTKK